MALAAGVDIKIVQEQLGHSTSTLTRDTYTRLSDGRDHRPDETPSLTQGLTRLSFPHYRPDFDTAVWYVSDDLILRDIDNDWLAICARTKPALDRFRHDHPGRWVNE